jgi:hypothetical protein
MTYRYSKTELALESPRLWCWERRLKLLFLATLADAFRLSLLKSAGPQLPAPNWWKGYYGIGAIEPESGTANLRYRFTDCVLL